MAYERGIFLFSRIDKILEGDDLNNSYVHFIANGAQGPNFQRLPIQNTEMIAPCRPPQVLVDGQTNAPIYRLSVARRESLHTGHARPAHNPPAASS